MAAIPKRTSKILRYYWRELFFREAELFAQWRSQQMDGTDEWGPVSIEAKEHFRKLAIKEIKELHLTSPKYQFAGISQEEVIRRFSIELIKLEACYTRLDGESRACVMDSGETVFVEEFVMRHFQRLGDRVVKVESVPFHVLFGTLLFPLIQDPEDAKQRISSFGEREAARSRQVGQVISTFLPRDFGTPGYPERRAAEIDEFFVELPLEREELLWQFDQCLEPSWPLRQYLWAERHEDVVTARTLLEVLPGEVIHRILRYLVESYWERFVGLIS